jgi:uncharacterized protein YfaS (alpha-2-macroglobulin family)
MRGFIKTPALLMVLLIMAVALVSGVLGIWLGQQRSADASHELRRYATAQTETSANATPHKTQDTTSVHTPSSAHTTSLDSSTVVLTPEWLPYLSELPNRWLGSQQQLHIRFNRHVATPALQRRPPAVRSVPADMFHARWLDAQTIQLTPKQPLLANTTVQIYLDSQGLQLTSQLQRYDHSSASNAEGATQNDTKSSTDNSADNSAKSSAAQPDPQPKHELALAPLALQFQVLPQQFSLRELGFQIEPAARADHTNTAAAPVVQSSEQIDPQANRASEPLLTYQFDLHSLDQMTLEQLQPLMTASLGSDAQQSAAAQAVSIQWQQLQPRRWRGSISQIQQKDTAQWLTLQWHTQRNETSAPNTVSPDDPQYRVKVPARHSFEILSVQLSQTSQHQVDIRFSKPLQRQQALDGIVRINGVDVNVKVQQNRLLAFAADPLRGDIEVDIAQGLLAEDGSSLPQGMLYNLHASTLLPKVSITEQGYILPAAEQIVLPLEVTNARAVRLRIFEIYPHNIGQYIQQQGQHWQQSYGQGALGRYLDEQRLTLPIAALNSTKSYQLDITSLLAKYRGSLLRLDVSLDADDSLFDCAVPQATSTPRPPSAPPSATVAQRNYVANDLQYSDTSAGSGWQRLPWYLGQHYYSGGYFEWSERENPCHQSYFHSYNDNVAQSRLYIASNIGMIARMGSSQTAHQLHIATTDLQQGQPLGKVQLDVYNYQQQIIAQGSTDANGMATLTPAGVPFYIKARHGDDSGYLVVAEHASLPTNQFDVAGVDTSDGVRGFFYADRDMWRPGDTIHLMLMLHQGSDSAHRANPVLPTVSLDVFDSRQQKIMTLVQRPFDGASTAANPQEAKTQQHGLYRFDIPTDAKAPTGNWHAVARVHGRYFDTRLKLEHIQPNRLAIQFTAPPQLDTHSQRMTLQSTWLSGGPAHGLKADVDIKLSPMPTRFKGYSQFNFDDFSRRFENPAATQLDLQLDTQGAAEFSYQPTLEVASPGMLRALIQLRVFESSGDFSSQYQSIPLLPYTAWSGIQLPEQLQKQSITTKEQASIALVRLDSHGKPQPQQGLHLSIYQLSWRWWWEQDSQAENQYLSDQLQTMVRSELLTTDQNGEAHWQLDASTLAAGRYLLRSCAQSDRMAPDQHTHCSSQVFYVDDGFGEQKGTDSATRLRLSSDKAQYNVGDTATVYLPKGPARQVLVSIEHGNGVLSQRWQHLAENEQQIQVPLTAAMVPNVYVHLSQIQPHQQRQNDQPLRSYGILNLSVADPSTRLTPELTLPSQVAPESELRIAIAEQQGRAMSYTLAIVDEGLLGITGYNVADPHQGLYQRLALGVRSWDLFDHVVGAYSSDLRQRLTVGGAELLPKRQSQRERRFKPLVQFYGPWYLAAGERTQHNIKLPPFMGSARVMLVAGDGRAYGSTQATVRISQPLTLHTSAPRQLGYEEHSWLPVTVFLQPDLSTEGSPTPVSFPREVTVRVSASAGLTLAGLEPQTSAAEQAPSASPTTDHSVTQRLVFKAPGEQIAYVKVQANRGAHQAKISVTAESAGLRPAHEQLWLPLYEQQPTQVRSVSTLLPAAGNATLALPWFGIENTRRAYLQLSTSPDFALARHMSALNHQAEHIGMRSMALLPELMHSATQTASATVDPTQLQRQQQVMQRFIQQLPLYQTPDGWFARWMGHHASSLTGAHVDQQWVVGLVLQQAQRLGYEIPPSILGRFMAALKKTVNDFHAGGGQTSGWSTPPQRAARDTNMARQASLLWLLAMADQSEVGAMNRLKLQLDKLDDPLATTLLALAYQAMAQADTAHTLFQNARRSLLQAQQAAQAQPDTAWQSAQPTSAAAAPLSASTIASPSATQGYDGIWQSPFMLPSLQLWYLQQRGKDSASAALAAWQQAEALAKQLRQAQWLSPIERGLALAVLLQQFGMQQAPEPAITVQLSSPAIASSAGISPAIAPSSDAMQNIDGAGTPIGSAPSSTAASTASAKTSEPTPSSMTSVQLQKAQQHFLLPQYRAEALALQNQSNVPVYATLDLHATPALGEDVSQQQGLALAMHITQQTSHTTAQALDLQALPQGVDLTIDISLQNLTGDALEDVRLSLPMPAGWQVRAPLSISSAAHQTASTLLMPDAFSAAASQQAELTQPSQSTPQGLQIRWQQSDDRGVSAELTLPAHQLRQQLRLQVTTTYAGRYYLPAWQAIVETRPNIRAQLAGQWVGIAPAFLPKAESRAAPANTEPANSKPLTTQPARTEPATTGAVNSEKNATSTTAPAAKHTAPPHAVPAIAVRPSHTTAATALPRGCHSGETTVPPPTLCNTHRQPYLMALSLMV